VNAVWIRFRAELRTRWKAWLVLAVLAGIAGGLVIGVMAGARRTDSAVDRHAEVHRLPDLAVNMSGQSPYFEQVARLPQVVGAGLAAWLVVVGRTREGEPLPQNGPVSFWANVDGRFWVTEPRPKLLAGRLPDQRRPDEALATPGAFEALGIRLGDTFRLRLVTLESFEQTPNEVLLGADPETAEWGPLAEVRIVGVAANPFPADFSAFVHLTSAFYRAFGGGELAAWTYALNVRLQRGREDIQAFEEAVAEVTDGSAFVYDTQADFDTVRSSIHLQAQALWLVAAIGAVSALALLGLALARQTAFEAVDNGTLRALGMSARQLVAIGTARAALVGLVAAAVSILVAAAVSPLLPIGHARELEPDPGFALEPMTVGVGAAAVFVATLLTGLLATWRANRARKRRGPSEETGAPPARACTAELLARQGFPATIVAGVRLALAPGRGASAVPVRTTIAGAVLAVAVLGLALTFSASLAHLFDTPRLYGQNWDYAGWNVAEEELDRRVVAIRADPSIEAAALAVDDWFVSIGGHDVSVVAADDVKGSVPPTVIDGRAPRAPDEILLASKEMDALGVEIGDVVEVEGSERSGRLRVVGRGVLPTALNRALGEGAALTFQALRQIEGDIPPWGLQVRIAPGADREAVLARLQREWVDARPVLPALVADFGGVDELPLAVAALFAAVTAAVLAHTLVTSIRRRRRDLAVLKTLGFDRSQVLATVAWQATTVAAIGLLIGLPIGIGLGRWAWNLFAEDLGVVPEPVTPLWPVLLVVPATILLANLVAALPGRMAARTQPALVLRAE
jgi:hypothetical protein